MSATPETIRVLHVDDDPEFGDTVATFLELEDERFAVDTATRASDGLDRLSETQFDCVVSDYDMPGRNGIEFLEAVRERYPDLPFVLYTGKGSEEVASDAISAGVTDYVQKKIDPSQYAVLANRISNAVEAARSASEADRRRHRLEQILKTVPGGVVQVDADGRFVFANRRAAEVLELDHDEVIERRYDGPGWEIQDLDGESISDDELPFRRVYDAGEPQYGIRHVIQWPDGTRKVLLVNGAPLFGEDGTVTSAVLSFTDVTASKERQRELAYRESVLEAALEASLDGILVSDEDRTPISYNQQLLDMWGLSADQLEADDTGPGADLVREQLERPETHMEVIDRITDNPRETHHDQIELVDGRVIDRYTAPVVDDDGFYGRVWFFRDITERKRQAEVLSERNDRMEQFANVVSHDLRNPLDVIDGRLELAREECTSPHLDAIDDAIGRMERIVDGVLWLAREGRDIGDTEPVDLADTVAAAWRIAGGERHGPTLVVGDVGSTDGFGRIEADGERLQQLLENLFRNAIDHAGDDVTVTVAPLADGFAVEDDGAGILQADRPSVFDAGYSTSDAGTGFGLSIVERIARAHGWDVRVTEGAEGGARFEITGVEFDDRAP